MDFFDRGKTVEISSRDWWIKIVGMLQQNWALIESNINQEGCTIYFVNDISGVFDRLHYPYVRSATSDLRRNRFSIYHTKTAEFQIDIPKPEPPFFETTHVNGQIYSSGRYWFSRTHNLHHSEDSHF